MHTHDIDFNLPWNLGKIKAQVDHRPLDADHIELIVTVEKLPTFIKPFLPKEMKKGLNKATTIKLKRSFVKKWGVDLTVWADEPVPTVIEGQPSAE